MPGFSGDLSAYTTITIHATGYSSGNEYRLIFYGPEFEGGQKILGAFYSNGGTYNLEERGFTKEQLKSITAINLAGGSGSGSIVINEIYLTKPTSVDFNESGIATIGLTDISADSNLTFDDQTGAMTSNGQGTFSVTLNNEDFRSVTKVELLRSGDDIVQTLQVTDAINGALGTFYSSKYNLDFTNYQAQAGQVTKLAWNCNTAGTMTITGIRLTANVITATTPGEMTLNTLPYQNMEGTAQTPSWNIGTETSTYYGSIEGSSAVSYADLKNYDELRIYRNDNTGFRAFFINSAGSGVNTITNESAASSWNATGKYWAIDLSQIENYESKVALQGIKSSASWINNAVNNIVVYKIPEGRYTYSLSGSGALSTSATAALADVTATAYDATGITAATELTPANPNALFIANAGMVTNSSNVIVNGTCANLVLADGYPFAAPSDFTATAASYSTTINTTAQVGTLCLPFAAAIPDGVTAYTLAYTSGDAATATPVETTIPANTPVLLNGSGAATFTGASAAVAASASNVSGAMTGVFATTTVPTNSYVLQNGDSGVGFYKVDSDITANPFRAYLTAQGAGSKMRIIYPDNEATGIATVEAAAAEEGAIYNLAGVRVSQPTKGIYIQNGKKFIVK